jgi:acetylornithine deacetylase/succinyl-diaminopimelate desuccinylase-like protein
MANGLGMSKSQNLMLTTKKLLPTTLKILKKKDPDIAKVIHSLSRMTISPNIIKGGIKSNVIPANATISVDIRTLPGQDENYIITHLRKALGDLAADAEIVTVTGEEGGINCSGNASEASSNFVSAMENAICEVIPNSSLVPFMMPAVTDLRFFRERGSQCYGFSLMDPETSTKDMAGLPHGTDERVRISSVELTLKAYYHLAKLF